MTTLIAWTQLRRLRPSPAVLILGAFVLIGVVVALIRYAFGIGAISNLNNSYSWGIWISFDLLCGVALGAGAFTMGAIVYILDLKEFRPILRPAILTGFLGYLMVITALLVHLRRAGRITVGLSVMLYTTVLAIEFLPVLFERTTWQKPLRILHTITLPLVIAGV